MSTATPPRTMTVEQMLALPDQDSVHRELIEGELRESTMTVRNRNHSQVEALVVNALVQWQKVNSQLDVQIHSGEVGCILTRDPDTVVGVDVACFAKETVAASGSDTTLIVGPPLLAVEILSPSDTQESINAKVELYLSHGVALVWVIDAHFRYIRVHRPEGTPEFFTTDQTLTSEPTLPGFTCDVRDLFA